MAQDRMCQIAGCDNPFKARGWCNKHWARWSRHGDPLYTPDKTKPPCSVGGCERISNTRGYCDMHYQRVQSHGNPHIVKVRRDYKSDICAVKKCDRPRSSLGYCSKHYERFRKHGTPHGLHPRHKRKVRWIRGHVNHSGDLCLKWPFGVSDHGRGVVTIKGKHMSAPRAMCLLAHGEPPTPEHHAAHTCGKGHEGCMNPRHLRWATPSENERDKIKHGTIRRGSDVNTSKLSADQVREIRGLRGTMTGVEIAKRYGVTPAMISSIYKGKAWAWLE